nr:sialic acid-binding Ig-like lectin 11 [Loxodonta africana]
MSRSSGGEMLAAELGDWCETARPRSPGDQTVPGQGLALLAQEMLLLLLVLLLFKLWEGALSQDPDCNIEILGSVTVQEGLCVLVPCIVSYPRYHWTDSDPAYGYWHNTEAATGQRVLVATNNGKRTVQEGIRDRFQFFGNPQSYDGSLSIRNVRMEDRGTYIFRLERGDYMKHTFVKELFLLVTGRIKAQKRRAFSPQPGLGEAFRTLGKPEIYVPRTLVSRCRANLNCTVPWASSALSLSTAPKTLSKGSLPPVLVGQPLLLACTADCNPPATLSWACEGKSLNTFQPSAPGVLKLPQGEAEDEKEFTCLAQNSVGSQHISLSLSVYSELLGMC